MSAQHPQKNKHHAAGNLLDGLPDSPEVAEIFQTLLLEANVCIERIISAGQTSPPDFWYEEPRREWVMLVQGRARLRFEDEPQPRTLSVGDYLYIAPYRRHRVEFTQANPATVWLAIYIDNPAD